jgi:nitrite reductase/ring-hydroxylating ferredoxin subunit
MDPRDDDRSRAARAGHDVMGATTTIAGVDDIAEGKGKAFDVGEKRIAIFNVAGKFHAIDDTCPHAGASLAEGHLEGGNIGCPWHYAEFELATGKHLHAPATCGVAVYPVQIEDGQIKVEVA